MSDGPLGEATTRPLVLDACVVLNLYATGRMGEILGAQDAEIFVAERVRREALKVGHGGGGEEFAEPELVNLIPLIESGVLRVAKLDGDAELTAFVRLARDLDDGEAECGSIAMCRGWRVATDDKKARRVLSGITPVVGCVRTSEMMRVWAERVKPADGILKSALRDIRARARFEPSPTDPLWHWWMASRRMENETAD